MNLQIFQLNLSGVTLKIEDIPKLRGCIANQFPEQLLLHNHDDHNRLRYGYPLIQYKLIRQAPSIVGINEGAELLEKIHSQINHITIRGHDIPLNGKEYSLRKELLVETDTPIYYQFDSPWAALNQDNFLSYISMEDERERESLLLSILKGNILSLCKGLGYEVKEPLEAVLDLAPTTIKLKDRIMTAFKGSFRVNMILPDYLGLGKAVSRGFGTIRRR